ncbi:hypothetical protein L7F22_047896 [Adiantum nelumboides]|nr:hypothetical protein [Adiantum nelumboides]
MGSKGWAPDLAKMEDKFSGQIKDNKKIMDTGINAILIRLSKMEKDMETWQKEKEEWEKDRAKWEEEKIDIQAQMKAMKVAYFITLVVIVSYFLVNIVVAAISGVFLRVRHEHQALLKKNRSAKKFSFYNATVLASILKDVILEDTNKMSCAERFHKRSEQMKARLTKAVSKTSSRMKRVLSSTQSFGSSFVSRVDTIADVNFDWDPEGRTTLSRKYSRSMSRSMSRSVSRGAKAARQTVASKCRGIVRSRLFTYSERFAITANLLLLCLHHEGMSNKLLYSLYALEALFIIVFTGEMVLRFLALGLVDYMDDQMNVWDTFVIALSAGSIMTRAYPNISGARMLRWFYVNKRETKKHTSIVADCIQGLGALSAVSFFYILIIFIFSVIGMQLYAGEFYHFYDGYPRDNFDSIFEAMFLWFTCTTADNWVNQMWNAMRPGVANFWIAPFLFVAYFIITVFLVLNLIIAVILEKTELSDSQKKQIQKAEYLKHLKSRQKRLFSSKGSGTWLVGAVEGASAGVKSISKRLYTKKVQNITIPRPNAGYKPSEAPSGPSMAINPSKRAENNTQELSPLALKSEPSPHFPRQAISRQASQVTSQLPISSASTSASANFRPSMQGRPSLSTLTTPPGSAAIGKRASQILFGTGFPVAMPNQQAPNTALRNSILALVNQPSNVGALAQETLDQPLLQQQQSRKPFLRAESRASFQLEEYEEMGKSFKLRDQAPWYLSNTSLFIFSPDSELRLLCHKIVRSKIFSAIILAIIAISVSVVISMSQASGLAPVFVKLNIFVFTMFALEFLMKIIAFGFLLTPDPYLGDVYNFLDLFLLILDALFLVPIWNPTQLTVVRILSAFRPLRLLCRIQGMKVLTTNLLRTIPAVTSVLAFTFIVFSVFAVVGVQLFRGRYTLCNSSVDHKINCVGTDLTSAQILGPRVWSNPPYHFDNFPAALLSLFIISTFDNVQNGFIYPAMDMQGPKGTQPAQNRSPMNVIFFIVFICVGGFFILRMFVGVFIDQFGLISGSKLLTERQKLLRDTNRIIQRMSPIYRPKVPRFWFRKFCHRIVTSPKYPKIIRGVVLTNYTWLSSHFAGQPAFLTVHRNRIEASFATFYVLDITVKLLGHEVKAISCLNFGYVSLLHPFEPLLIALS